MSDHIHAMLDDLEEAGRLISEAADSVIRAILDAAEGDPITAMHIYDQAAARATDLLAGRGPQARQLAYIAPPGHTVAAWHLAIAQVTDPEPPG